MKKTLYGIVLLTLVFSVAVYGANKHKPGARIQNVNPVVRAIMMSSTAKAFKNQPVTDQMIDQIIQCGIKAPSAMNQQPWHFTVITSRELLDQMDADSPQPQGPPKGEQPGASNQKPGQPGQPAGPARPKRHLFLHAPVVILISVTEDSKFSIFDAALACENMSLAAQEMGLGTHIVAAVQVLFEGPRGGEYLKKLQIPGGKKPWAALAIGWPEQGPDAVSGASTRNANVVTYIK